MPIPISSPSRAKVRSLAILLLCQVGAMTVWFSSASVVATVKQTQAVSAQAAALLTSALQVGFVAGTIFSAVLSLADRFDPRRLFMASALVAAAATAWLVVPAADRSARVCLALSHRRVHGRRVSRRHAAGGDLGPGRPRPADRPAGRRPDAGFGQSAPAGCQRRAGLAPRVRRGRRLRRARGLRCAGLPDRPADGARGPAGPVEIHAGLARPGRPARQPGLPGAHVGAVCDVGLARGVPAGQLHAERPARCRSPGQPLDFRRGGVGHARRLGRGRCSPTASAGRRSPSVPWPPAPPARC